MPSRFFLIIFFFLCLIDPVSTRGHRSFPIGLGVHGSDVGIFGTKHILPSKDDQDHHHHDDSKHRSVKPCSSELLKNQNPLDDDDEENDLQRRLYILDLAQREEYIRQAVMSSSWGS